MSATKAAYQPSTTDYSEVVPGDVQNHQLPARFDVTTSGYVGISQDGDRVLLTPKQFRRLVEFVKASK